LQDAGVGHAHRVGVAHDGNDEASSRAGHDEKTEWTVGTLATPGIRREDKARITGCRDIYQQAEVKAP
jgi:hypothetical protein